MARGEFLYTLSKHLMGLSGTITLLLAIPQPVFGSATTQHSRLLLEKPPLSKFSPASVIKRNRSLSQLYLVIRLSDRRVDIYQKEHLLTSYPIAVGRDGWETPTGRYQVIQKIQNPAWEHPFTGEIVPPGPDNPLGMRWIGFWTDGTNYIGFHGTPNEETVGQAASHGCIRMLNQDVLALFEKVSIGTPVIVQP